MNAMTIARVELRRFLRDRSNIFFVFVLPLLLVIFIGAQFGGGAQIQLGAVHESDDALAAAVLEAVAADDIEIVDYDDREALLDAVARARISGGIVIEPGFAAALRRLEPADIAFVGRPDARAMALRTVVAGAVDEVAEPYNAARAASTVHDRTSPDELVGLARIAAEIVEGPRLVLEAQGGDPLAQEFAGLGQFDFGASSQLFLFVFLTSMTSAIALIQSRELGITSRVLSTPTPMAMILIGSAGGRLLVAIAQAAYIVVATVLLFQVNWGDPLAAAVVILLFCVVSAGASMLIGAALRNESQAGGAGIGLGIGLAALGGSMVPLEIFPEGMRPIAFLTPHAWANEAMAELVRRDGGLADVLTEVTVLAAYAAGLLALATWRLRVVLTR